MQEQINEQIIFEQIDEILAKGISENEAILQSLGIQEPELNLSENKQEVAVAAI